MSEEDTNGVKHVSYTGLNNIEEMRKIVETTTVNALSISSNFKTAIIDEVAISYNTIAHYPFFFANNIFTISFNYHSGYNIFN